MQVGCHVVSSPMLVHCTPYSVYNACRAIYGVLDLYSTKPSDVHDDPGSCPFSGIALWLYSMTCLGKASGAQSRQPVLSSHSRQPRYCTKTVLVIESRRIDFCMQAASYPYSAVQCSAHLANGRASCRLASSFGQLDKELPHW